MTEEYLLSEDELALEGVDFRKKAEHVVAARRPRWKRVPFTCLKRYLGSGRSACRCAASIGNSRAALLTQSPICAMRRTRPVRCGKIGGSATIPFRKLAELLEERGIKILSLDLDDIDGLAAKVRRKDRDAARVIVIKQSTLVGAQALQPRPRTRSYGDRAIRRRRRGKGCASFCWRFPDAG